MPYLALFSKIILALKQLGRKNNNNYYKKVRLVFRVFLILAVNSH
ncbi:glutathione-dependent formaldehyde-activating, GFA [Aggregatibacter aphrophilus NJ8700]|jgi:glutathione-dependent formaldehyde-activating, GFA|nr:glutathione-dependent formaldehyde-activating, GFA [Aggregatibacter aphrophilus NJ8700]